MQNTTIPGLALAINALAALNIAIPVIGAFVVTVITAWRTARGSSLPLKDYIDQLEKETDENGVKLVARIAGLRQAIEAEVGQ